MSLLNFEGKKYLITGVANKKSVAYFVAKNLLDLKAELYFTVLNEELKEKVSKLFPESKIFILDVENEKSVLSFGEEFKKENVQLNGILHSIAFANYSEGIRPFHETKLQDYLQASTISCFSLTMLANALKDSLDKLASVVTISISSTRATNYG